MGAQAFFQLIEGLAEGGQLDLHILHAGGEGAALGVEPLAEAGQELRGAVPVEDQLPAAVGEDDVDGGLRLALPAGGGLGGVDLLQEALVRLCHVGWTGV